MSDPGGTAGRAREAVEGVGEVAWAGLNPAPDVPLNVPIGPAPPGVLGAEPSWPTSRR